MTLWPPQWKWTKCSSRAQYSWRMQENLWSHQDPHQPGGFPRMVCWVIVKRMGRCCFSNEGKNYNCWVSFHFNVTFSPMYRTPWRWCSNASGRTVGRFWALQWVCRSTSGPFISGKAALPSELGVPPSVRSRVTCTQNYTPHRALKILNTGLGTKPAGSS